MMDIENLKRQTHLCNLRPLNKEDQAIWPEKNSFAKYLQELKNLRVKDQEYHFGVFLKSDQSLVASVAIKGVVRDNIQSAYLEIGKNKKDIGNLMITEFLAAVLDIAFHELVLNRIEILLTAGELQIKQVAKSLALREEGIRKKAIQIKSNFEDVSVFAICRDEYESKNIKNLMQAGAKLR